MKTLLIGISAFITYCLAAAVSDRVSMDMSATHWGDAWTWATFLVVMASQMLVGFLAVMAKLILGAVKNRRKLAEIRANIGRVIH